MAKKTKAPKSSLHEHAPISIALHHSRSVEIDIESIAAGIDAAEKALATLRHRQTRVLTSASYVRRLLESEVNGRSPSRRENWEAFIRRVAVAEQLPPLPRSHPPKRKGQPRKRLSRKQAGKEFFHEHELPH